MQNTVVSLRHYLHFSTKGNVITVRAECTFIPVYTGLGLIFEFGNPEILETTFYSVQLEIDYCSLNCCDQLISFQTR